MDLRWVLLGGLEEPWSVPSGLETDLSLKPRELAHMVYVSCKKYDNWGHIA